MKDIDRPFLHALHEQILHAVIKEGAKYNLKHLLSVLRTHIEADTACLFFVEENQILTMIVDSQDAAGIPLLVGTDLVTLHTERIPEKTIVRHSESFGIYGNKKFASTLTVPVRKKGQLVAVMEFGKDTDDIDSDKAVETAKAIAYLHTVLLSAHEDTRRFEANRKLRALFSQTERQFRILLENTRDIILSFTPDGALRSINEIGKNLLCARHDIESCKFNPVSPDLSFIANLLKNGTPASDLEVVVEDDNRQPRFLLASFSPEMDIHNNLVLIHAICKDITDRVESQKTLWQANYELSKAQELLEKTQLQMIQQEKLASIGQLAAGIAHEINNPLGFIMSNYETLKEYLDKMTRYITELEQHVPDSSQLQNRTRIMKILQREEQLIKDTDEGFSRISKIIQSLKDFSRTETRGVLSSVHIEQLLEDTLIVSRNSWKYVAEISTDYRLDQTVEAYGDLLNQVFMNIIVNAAQAIASQGRDTPGSIRITTDRDGDMALIIIEDDGPGLSREVIRRLFDPFFTTKPVGKGTGLGLSVSYDIIVKKHNGDILAENRIEGGARFIIRIPFNQTSQLETTGEEV